MKTIDKKKEEEERKARAREYDKKIFGEYFEQVLTISKKMTEGFHIKGETVIGIAKLKNEEPLLVFAGRSRFVPFSEINFSGLI
jgi:hypothetical protein